MRRTDNFALDRELFEQEYDDEAPVLEKVIVDAVGFARRGLRVFPVLRSSDKSRDKRPPPGFLWKDRSSDRVADVVQEFAAAVQDHGADFIGVAWALGLDGYCAVDDDNGLPVELHELLDAPHAVNTTKRGCHRIFRQPAGMTPGNSTLGFPVQGWGEFRGVGGYIVITGADRPGFDPETLDGIAEFPRPDWLRDAGQSVAAANDKQVAEFINAHTGRRWLQALEIATAKLDELRADKNSRHEALKHVLPWMMRDARAGLYPAGDAVDLARAWWRRVVDDPGRREGPEFGSLLAWAIGCAKAEPDDSIERRARRGLPAFNPNDEPPPIGELATNLPDEFWSSRPRLAAIRQAAHSLTISPDAVLGAVLARVAMLTPPTLLLPAAMAATGTFDFIAANIGPPGVGKTSAQTAGRRLVPTERTDIVDGMPIGSGEGVVDAYLGPVEDTDENGRKRKRRRQVNVAVLAYVDEGQVLAELATRRGSTLMTTLRTAWSGGTLGQANATEETHRRVEAGRYRFAAIVGFQPAHAAAILDDVTGGTPQRFVWFHAIDPSIPDEAPTWPGPLDWTPPASFVLDEPIDIDDKIARSIRSSGLARARGLEVVNALDAHANLAQLKVAGLLAILDDRKRITIDDWSLARMVMTTSDRVRAAVTATAFAEALRREQVSTAKAVRRQTAILDTAETRAFESAKRSVGRRAHRGETDTVITRRELTQAIAGDYRRLVDVDDVIASAIGEGWIVTVEGGYRRGESRPR